MSGPVSTGFRAHGTARRPSRRPRGLACTLAALLIACAATTALPAASAAQAAEEWNGPRALELMARARERRAEPLADSLLRNYHSRAAGMVYFYLDQRDTDRRVLVRSDQIAVEVHWGAPDRTKQRIVGMRGEDVLPNRMYYHLDHLTVVQNEFGDVIRLGDGDEVRDVPHPAAPGAETIYDYRLTDSLTIRLPGAPEPVKAYRIDVRPKRTDQAALIGSVYVDRATADIVRMTFTFTPVSYVDRRLDYINISLDNSLWEGRYWLPYEQSVEIRRQVPELDFGAGAVIQGRFRITDYDFNIDLPPGFFAGYSVTAAPEAERRAYPFEAELYEDLNVAGLAPPENLRGIRARAAELIRLRSLSGLPALRLNLPDASSALRYDRAEGGYVGAGVSYDVGLGPRAELLAGYAFGAERVEARFTVRTPVGQGTGLDLGAYHNIPRDLGVRPGVPRALNTLTSFGFGNDYLDVYYASGARIDATRLLGSWSSISVGLSAERHRPATLTASTVVFGEVADFRPVLPVDRATAVFGTITLTRPLPDGDGLHWSGSARLQAGRLHGDGFGRFVADVGLRQLAADRRAHIHVRGAAGLSNASTAPQLAFLLGGRNTIPGYDYRAFGGDAFGLVDVEIARTLLQPWLGLRLLGAAGWASPIDVTGDDAAFTGWPTLGTDGIRASVGAGVSLFYDLVQLDLHRGLRGGEWRLLFNVQPDLWAIL